MEIRTSQIRELLNGHEARSEIKTLEVCASNEMSSVVVPDRERPAIFVVNTDPNFRRGKHWVLIHLQKRCRDSVRDSLQPPRTIFFDPLGFAPSHYGRRMVRFLKLNARDGEKYGANRKRLQKLTSSCCGFFCCFYAMQLMEGATSMQQITSRMEEMTENNIVSSVLVKSHMFAAKCLHE